MFNDISRLNSWTSASSCLIVHPMNTRGPGFFNKLVSESCQSTLCRHMMSLLWIQPLRVEPKDAELGRFSAHHSSSVLPPLTPQDRRLIAEDGLSRRRLLEPSFLSLFGVVSSSAPSSHQVNLPSIIYNRCFLPCQFGIVIRIWFNRLAVYLGSRVA